MPLFSFLSFFVIFGHVFKILLVILLSEDKPLQAVAFKHLETYKDSKWSKEKVLIN